MLAGKGLAIDHGEFRQANMFIASYRSGDRSCSFGRNQL